jgi:hypothetical protein
MSSLLSSKSAGQHAGRSRAEGGPSARVDCDSTGTLRLKDRGLASGQTGESVLMLANRHVWSAALALVAAATGLLEPIGAQRMQRTPDIHYVPTPNDVVKAMLDVAHVGPSDLVYDLG